MKYLSKLIPKSMQQELFRRVVTTEKLNDFQDVSIKLAETFEEYKKAFELLHDCYFKKGLMEMHPSMMRCNVHKKGEVVGTVSIIKDNPLSLPAESVYGKEIRDLRSSEGRELVEISALSIAPEYRQHSHAILFLLNKFLYIYSRDYMKSNTLIIVVHPNAEIFYSSLFLFKAIGKIISYDFVKGALARFMYMDFSPKFEKDMWTKVYKKRKNSLMDYILFQNDPRLVYPENKEDDIHTRNKEVAIRLIKASQFNLDTLNRMELSYVISSLNLKLEDLKALGLNGAEVISDYRFQKKIMAKGKIGSHDFIIRIYNLSTSGAFVEIPLNYLNEKETSGTISFKWKGNDFTSEFKVCWVNDGISKKLPKGCGIQFLDNQINFFEEDINYIKRKAS